MDSLGDRIKRYELSTHYHAPINTPLIVRVDGRSFHSLDLEKPFDSTFISAMVDAATATSWEMQGFKAAYIQSDEVTFLLTDYDKSETQPWFGYDLSKILSITASLMSVNFNQYFGTPSCVFDARAFSVPIQDVANVFLWRAKDWARNSLQMYCRSLYSHKEMHGKSTVEQHKMLFDKGKNWVHDLTPQERNGTYIVRGIFTRTEINVLPNYAAISNLIDPLVEWPNVG